jgi:hypothetical protein
MLDKMIAKMDAWVEGAETCVGELEASQEKSDTVAKHQEVPKEEVAVEIIRALEDRYGGLSSSCSAPPTAEEMDSAAIHSTSDTSYQMFE